MVQETQLQPEEGIVLMVDLRDKEDEEEEQGAEKERVVVEDSTGQTDFRLNLEQNHSGEKARSPSKKIRGKRSISSCKIHPMITRGLKSNSVIGHKSKMRRVVWNLEEEISKIIERGWQEGWNGKVEVRI